jgi:nitronate monooxygenase
MLASFRAKLLMPQIPGIDVPIVSAPMAFAATGKLASAVSKAGGFGMIGAGV